MAHFARGRFVFVWASCVVALFVHGCSSSDAPSAGDPSTKVSTSIANIDAIVCGDLPPETSGGPSRKEWYSLTALNGHLRNFPDFARAAGFQSVHTCDEARAVVAAYDVYGKAHPSFGAAQPLERTSRPLPRRLTPADVPPVEEPKILNGLTFGLSPVVNLVTTLTTPKLKSCTGTFIAKNWIVTAAHCLAVLDDQATTAMSALEGYANYDVFFYDSQGKKVAYRNFNALQYVQPNFNGVGKAGGNFQNDIALLYVPSDVYDGQLAPGPQDTTHTGNGPWMRLSLEPKPSSAALVFGTGEPATGTIQAAFYGDAAPFSNQASEVVGTVSAGGPFVCEGDSGGPVFDVVGIVGDSASDQPVLVDVLQSGDLCGSTHCACQGSHVYAVRVADQIGFIESTMAEWNGPNFECSFDLGVDNKVYVRCWGDPCKSGASCTNGQVCDQPGGAIFSGCINCGNPGDCSCIYGQCLNP